MSPLVLVGGALLMYRRNALGLGAEVDACFEDEEVLADLLCSASDERRLGLDLGSASTVTTGGSFSAGISTFSFEEELLDFTEPSDGGTPLRSLSSAIACCFRWLFASARFFSSCCLRASSRAFAQRLVNSPRSLF
jgi:hypothetical protein